MKLKKVMIFLFILFGCNGYYKSPNSNENIITGKIKIVTCDSSFYAYYSNKTIPWTLFTMDSLEIIRLPENIIIVGRKWTLR